MFTRENFIYKSDAVNRGSSYEFGAGDSDSCIITMSPPPTSTTEDEDKEYVDASPSSGERGAMGVRTFSSRTAPKGTGQLQTFLKNATSLI